MNNHRITTFTLTGPLATEAALLELEATPAKSDGQGNLIKPPGFTEVQCKELSVRIGSAFATIGKAGAGQSMDISFANRGLFGYSLQPTAGNAGALDLPIALALLGKAPDRLACAGELGLDGSLRPVRGILAFVHACRISSDIRGVLVPRENLREAVEAADGQISVYVAGHLREIVDPGFLIPDETTPANLKLHRAAWDAPRSSVLDFADISEANQPAVRAIAVAVRSNRDILLVGPASAAHTMIARRVCSIMRPLPAAQQIMLTKTYSSLGLASGLITARPFRAPHYTTSAKALAGTGTEWTNINLGLGRPVAARSGEVHLAAYGVLLLDCVNEFPKASLGALREALQDMRGGERPMIVATAHTHGVPTDRAAIARAEHALAVLGIAPDRIEIQAESMEALRAKERCRSSQDLRSEIWGLS